MKFNKKLEVLIPFSESIKKNYASVQLMENKVTKCLKTVEEFKTDDMFINSRKNYFELYQRLMKQEERYIVQTVPDIERLQ